MWTPGWCDNTATATGHRPPTGTDRSSATDTDRRPRSRQPRRSRWTSRLGVPSGNSARATRSPTRFVVTNTGNVTLDRRSASTTRWSAPVDLPGDDAGAGRRRRPARRPTRSTQADVDAGHVANTATVDGHRPNGTDVDGDRLHRHPDPGGSGDHPGQAGRDADRQHARGDTIDYTFVVTNTGNVTLTADRGRRPDGRPGVLPGHDVGAGRSRRPARRRYTLTQADVDAGVVDNTATATGTPPERRRR